MAVKGACCEPGSGGCNVTERDCSAPPAQRQHGDGDTGSSGDRQLTHQAVQDYYGRVLKSSRDLKTSACTAGGKPPALLRQGGIHICERRAAPVHAVALLHKWHGSYLVAGSQVLAKIPAEVLDKFYGCGAPLPAGINGLTVLDLGSGSGRDCYAAAALVGEHGAVIGVDMTPGQLQVARQHADEYCTRQLGFGASNMRFVEGHIEYLDAAGIADESVDVILSNCVVNLSPDKARVLAEAYRVLRPGGEFYFSDVYSDRRVPTEAQNNEVLWGECISGALYIHDFLDLARRVGFANPRQLQKGEIAVHDDAILAQVEGARFYSITYRLFKLPDLLEPASEDYGHVATYKGSIPGQPHVYALDERHEFEKGRPVRVCGNTAAMLGEGGVSWLAPHFMVTGDRSVHFGAFCDGNGDATSPSHVQPSSALASCCG